MNGSFRSVSPAFFLIAALLLIMGNGCRNKNTRDLSQAGSSKQLADSIRRLDSLAITFSRTDTALSRRYASLAVRISSAAGMDTALTMALAVKGEVLSRLGDDSARTFLLQSLDRALLQNSNRNLVRIYYSLGQLHFDANDLVSAAVLYDSSAMAAMRIHNYHYTVTALIAMAAVSLAADDPETARNLYDSSVVLAGRHGLPNDMAIAMGNLADFEPDKARADSLLQSAIALLQKGTGFEQERANFLINRGLLQKDPDQAIRIYRTAIRIAAGSHLPVVTLAAFNNMAYAWLDKGMPDMAAAGIGDTAIPLAISIENHDWLSTLYDTYADIQLRMGRSDSAIIYLRRSAEARYKADRLIAKREVRHLQASLNLKNKNLIILRNEKEITNRNATISSMIIGLAAALLIILSLAALFVWFRMTTRNRMALLKLDAARSILEAEEHEREKTSMELHDAIGALNLQVSHAIETVEGDEQKLKSQLSGHIYSFTQRVRAISHRMSSRTLKKHDPVALLSDLCFNYAEMGRMKLKWTVSGSLQGGSEASIHIYRIAQELLANARKYAPDAEISLGINFTDTQCAIEYRDNGPGFNSHDGEWQGLGISNIFARTKLLNGEGKLDSSPGFGVYWHIIIPL